MTRDYHHSMWCIKKHLLLAKTHTHETLQKLYRECKPVCDVTDSTRLEAELAVSNLAAAEEHLEDVISQSKEPKKLREIIDEVRETRQGIALTNIPFRANLKVKSKAVKKLEKTHQDIDELLSDVDLYATDMEQEQVHCQTCMEDLKSMNYLSESDDSMNYLSNPDKNDLNEDELSKKLKENNDGGNGMGEKNITGWLDGITKSSNISKIYGGELIARVADIPLDMLLTGLGKKIGTLAIGGAIALGATKMRGVPRLKDELHEIASHLITGAIDPTPAMITEIRGNVAQIRGALKLNGGSRLRAIKNALVRSKSEVKAAVTPAATMKAKLKPSLQVQPVNTNVTTRPAAKSF